MCAADRGAALGIDFGENRVTNGNGPIFQLALMKVFAALVFLHVGHRKNRKNYTRKILMTQITTMM